MPLKTKSMKTPLFFSLMTALILSFLLSVPMALANPSLLRKAIIDFNLSAYEKSLSDQSYQGAEGILLMGPEVARSLGLKALINQDYLDAKALDAKATLLFSQAVSALTTRKKERFVGEHAKTAGDLALQSKEALLLSRKHFRAYRSALNPEVDERLDRGLCTVLLDELLKEGLKRASNNLRDGCGFFYNRCHGLPEDSAALSPGNVRFVNHVFYEFTHKSSDRDKKLFDLGKQVRRGGTNPGSSWKQVLQGEPLLTSLLEKQFDGQKKGPYTVDPLLFIALMRRESNFDPRAVSYVGAAGLTQIMPKTGKGLGMKHIYMPSYFEKATTLLGRERKLRQKARALVSGIALKNRDKTGKIARDLMQKSLRIRRERSELFGRYKRQLLKKDWDDRLKPGKAIAYGYKYFSGLMKAQKGDISLALASYNAGPHRVKQYQGIPPYKETVSFRNMVMKFYREYLRKLKH